MVCNHEVRTHLLHRPQQPLDLSRYLDPLFVRSLDSGSVLAERLPSVDRNFAVRHDLKSKRRYFHRIGNIRLTTKSYNFGKGCFLTAHVADDLEYSLFCRQTVSQVEGDAAAPEVIDRIGERVHAAYLAGESSQASWHGLTGGPREVKAVAQKLGPSIIADTHDPLLAPTPPPADETRDSQPSSCDPKGKGKAKEVEQIEEDEQFEDDESDAADHSDLEDRDVEDDGDDFDAMCRVRETWPAGDSLNNITARAPKRPRDLLADLNSLVLELEQRYPSRPMRRKKMIPEPFGSQVDGLSREELLDRVWAEAARLHSVCQHCNESRHFKAPPGLELQVPDDASLKGLSKYSAYNNSTFNMLVIACKSYLEGRLERCHATGLKLRSPASFPSHPLIYSLGHRIHGAPMSYGFSSRWPKSMAEHNELAQNVLFESRYINWWRRAARKLISALDMNKGFGIAYVRKMAAAHPEFGFSDEILEQVENVDVKWHKDTDERIHINVYHQIEQALFHHLTR